MRGLIWIVFALLSSYLFFAPIVENVRRLNCGWSKSEWITCKVMIMETKTDGSMGWFVPDIAKPWVDWIILNHPITTIILFIMAGLYYANRRYKSDLRLTAYFYWKHLPAKASGVSTQQVEDSILMKTKNIDTAEDKRKKQQGEGDKISMTEKFSKNVGQLGQRVSGSSNKQFRKLTRVVKRLNGTDY